MNKTKPKTLNAYQNCEDRHAHRQLQTVWIAQQNDIGIAGNTEGALSGEGSWEAPFTYRERVRLKPDLCIIESRRVGF